MQPPPAWNPELKNKKNIHTVPKSIQPISRYPAKSQCSNVQNSKCSKNIQEQSIDRYCQKLSGKGLTDKNRYVECDHGRHARGDKAWSKAEALHGTAKHNQSNQHQPQPSQQSQQSNQGRSFPWQQLLTNGMVQLQFDSFRHIERTKTQVTQVLEMETQSEASSEPFYSENDQEDI